MRNFQGEEYRYPLRGAANEVLDANAPDLEMATASYKRLQSADEMIAKDIATRSRTCTVRRLMRTESRGRFNRFEW